MHLCRDGDDFLAFCLNEKCLKEDVQISKGKAAREYADRKSLDGDFKQSGVEKFSLGSTYMNATLSKWIAPHYYTQSMKQWLVDQRPFLVLTGSTGTGKTYFCAALLNMYYEKNEEVYYTTHRRFVEEIHRAISDDKTQHSVIEKLANKKYLIIDDLGSATCTPWQQEMFLELIDRRYSNQLKTVITTNLDKNSFSEYLGERLASRILDKLNVLLEFWESDRRQIAI